MQTSDGKLLVVCISNPFDPLVSREIRQLEAGRPIGELIEEFYPEGAGDYHIEVSIDGAILSDVCKMALIPKAGTTIAFCAVPGREGGKNPLAIIAMLALIVVAPQIAIGVEGMLGIAASSGLISLASMGIIAVGGLIINAALPATMPDRPADRTLDTSPTYGWEPGPNSAIEGGPLPTLFGTHRVTPPILGSYIEVVGDKQYLNLLFALAGHELTKASAVRINDTLVTDDGDIFTSLWKPTGNFTGVVVEGRAGKVDQAVIQRFQDLRADVSVGVKLNETDWVTRTTTGDQVEGIGIGLALPRGLFYSNNDGALTQQSVKVYLEYRMVGDPDWVRFSQYNTTTGVVSGRWSAGVWKVDGSGWFEISAGSAVVADHLEGDIYTEPLGWRMWQEVTDVAGQFNPVVYWRWISSDETVGQFSSLSADYALIFAAQVKPLYRTYYKLNLTAGQYEIRAKLVEALPVGFRFGNDTYFEFFEEIVHDPFTHPGTALLAIRALATDQLSGGKPRVDVLLERGNVPVWTGAAYEAKPSDNPAWACYQVLHRGWWDSAGVVYFDGIAKERIVYADFASWADWCTERGYTVNLYSDAPMSVRRMLDVLSVNGRGTVVQMGSKFTCIVDRPEPLPVQRFMFGMGNIEQGSFTEEWLPMGDRANAIEVTYWDRDLDYTRQTVTLYSDGFDASDREENTISVTLWGCTDRDLAIKYGKGMLNRNRYLTLTGSWGADVDAIACRVGDVVETSHDVPQWGYSGRIVSSSEGTEGVQTETGEDGAYTDTTLDGAEAYIGGASTITLDREVTIEAGVSYTLRVQHFDDTFEDFIVAEPPGVYTTVSITGVWATAPAQFEKYSFGETGRVVKEFRVLNISRDQDLRRKLTCLEYVAEVYDETATIPPPEEISDLPFVARLAATEIWKGGAETRASLSWAGFALYWNVFYRAQGDVWRFAGKTFAPSFEIPGLDYGVTYDFGVSSTNDPAGGAQVSLQLRGKIDPPGDVAAATATLEGYGCLIEWTRVHDFDVTGYELRLGSTWASSTFLAQADGLSYRWNVQTAAAYTILIKAIDAFGNYSENAKSVDVTIAAPPAASPVFTVSGPDIVLAWGEVVSQFAIAEYEIRYGGTYGASTFLATTKGTSFSTKGSWSGTRRFWITAVDVAGNYGTPSSVDVIVQSPGQVGTISAGVIDNNVLLKWSAPSTGTLPVESYEVRRGATFAGATVIGTKTGTFTTVFEDASGANTYWVVAVDTAGNYGTERSVGATVNQPPDYFIIQDWLSTFPGTLNNAILDGGKVLLPVNATETWEEHFTTPAPDWASIQDQIDAGYPIYIEPSQASGYYEETFDYGGTVSGSTVTLSVATTTVAGAPALTPKISISLNGADWTDYDDTYQIFASSFRYVKIRLTVASSGGDDLLRIDEIRVKLDMKQRTDAGVIAAVSTDSGGTTVTFNVAFMDVIAINLTPLGTAARYAIYDFTDAPNPTDFKVLLFDTSGNRASGDVAWVARGV